MERKFDSYRWRSNKNNVIEGLRSVVERDSTMLSNSYLHEKIKFQELRMTFEEFNKIPDDIEFDFYYRRESLNNWYGVEKHDQAYYLAVFQIVGNSYFLIKQNRLSPRFDTSKIDIIKERAIKAWERFETANMIMVMPSCGIEEFIDILFDIVTRSQNKARVKKQGDLAVHIRVES